jgi:hypothetical protein
MEDLAQYEAQWRTPLSFKYKDLNIISMDHQAVEEYVYTNIWNDCTLWFS